MHHAPLIIDIAGTTLNADDRRRLQHPLTGQPLEFRAPLPDELNRFIETLPE